MIRVSTMALLWAMLVPGVVVWGQEEVDPSAGDRSAGDQSPTASTPTGQPESSAGARSAGDRSPAGDADEPGDSPFDYEASEQISEDLSVSFPVDI